MCPAVGEMLQVLRCCALLLDVSGELHQVNVSVIGRGLGAEGSSVTLLVSVVPGTEPTADSEAGGCLPLHRTDDSARSRQ